MKPSENEKDYRRYLDLVAPLVLEDYHTDAWGERLYMVQWLPFAERIVERIYGPLPIHELAALVSLFSSAGYTALARSCIRTMIDKGDKKEAAIHWNDWVLTSGNVDPAKVKRRKRESTLYLTGRLE
jgi:GH24 family phage-related lysozyme (muramidase)